MLNNALQPWLIHNTARPLVPYCLHNFLNIFQKRNNLIISVSVLVILIGAFIHYFLVFSLHLSNFAVCFCHLFIYFLQILQFFLSLV